MKNENQSIKTPYLSLQKLVKQFGHTQALDKMSLDIHLGEIIGLVGPNGAGKSTLIKTITGVFEPTSGTIVFNGSETMGTGYNTNTAKSRGIACAYQELSLCTNLTVYENFMINHMDHKPFEKIGWRKRAKAITQAYMDTAFPDNGIDINTIVSDLSLAQMQMVEIAKAMSYAGIKILILDEPTSSLTGDRITQLHAAMKALAKKGVAIIYITHKLDEIERACDTVVVMKGGKTDWQGRREDATIKDLVEILGGKVEVAHRSIKDTHELPNILEIKNLETKDLHGIDMEIKKGEIVGISGLAGSGQKELLVEIFKAAKRKIKKPEIKLESNAAYLSGDRVNEGIFPLWDIADNTVISSLEQVTTNGVINKGKLRKLASLWYKKLNIKAQNINDDIMSLSGGNQQKAILARGLAADADLVLLNDPTCGVDVETKQEIYGLLEEAKNQGKTILLHSTEDLEMEQCDRVYVMHEGRVAAELVGEEIAVNNIITVSFKEKSKSTEQIDHEVVKKPRKGLLSKALNSRSALAFITLIAIFIVNSFLNPKVASYMGIELLFSSAVPLVFVALGQMFMVISGGIDLGNGQSVGLMNVIVAFVIATHPGLGLFFTLLFIGGYALLGVIIHTTKIPSIVITLGASFVWLGLGLLVSPVPGGNAPTWLSAIYRFQFPIIPMPIILAAVGGAIAYWIVKKSKYGMVVNGIGNNPAAVTRAGWSQTVAMIVAYALSGLFVALGGLMLTAIANSGDVNSTGSYCMLSIATIILGGCEFKGGIGAPIGVVAAALAITSISALLTFVGIDTNLQTAVTGLILIVALAIKLISSKLEARR